MSSRFISALLMLSLAAPAAGASSPDCEAAITRCESSARDAHAACALAGDGPVGPDTRTFVNEYKRLIRDGQARLDGDQCAKGVGYSKLRDAHAKHSEVCGERAESCLSACADLAIHCPLERRGRFRVLLGQCALDKDEGRIARNSMDAYDDALRTAADCRKPAGSVQDAQ